jgi:hypothetical protein
MRLSIAYLCLGMLQPRLFRKELAHISAPEYEAWRLLKQLHVRCNRIPFDQQHDIQRIFNGVVEFQTDKAWRLLKDGLRGLHSGDEFICCSGLHLKLNDFCDHDAPSPRMLAHSCIPPHNQNPVAQTAIATRICPPAAVARALQSR